MILNYPDLGRVLISCKFKYECDNETSSVQGVHYRIRDHRILCQLRKIVRQMFGSQPMTVYYLNTEPLSIYSSVMLHLSPATRILSENPVVRNFCACSSHVILQGNQQLSGKMSAVFSGYTSISAQTQSKKNSKFQFVN